MGTNPGANPTAAGAPPQTKSEAPSPAASEPEEPEVTVDDDDDSNSVKPSPAPVKSSAFSISSLLSSTSPTKADGASLAVAAQQQAAAAAAALFLNAAAVSATASATADPEQQAAAARLYWDAQLAALRPQAAGALQAASLFPTMVGLLQQQPRKPTPWYPWLQGQLSPRDCGPFSGEFNSMPTVKNIFPWFKYTHIEINHLCTNLICSFLWNRNQSDGNTTNLAVFFFFFFCLRYKHVLYCDNLSCLCMCTIKYVLNHERKK